MEQPERGTKVVKLLRGGRIIIPAQFRRELAIEEGGLLQISLVNGELRVKSLHVKQEAVGSPWLKELYDAFAPVRSQADKYSEDEINEAIDEAVRAVRKLHAQKSFFPRSGDGQR
jgi:bifunctional DNA-binding transcriptional regulator/antitoxin component of YhaV-PrlF toxin-antitoxin module